MYIRQTAVSKDTQPTKSAFVATVQEVLERRARALYSAVMAIRRKQYSTQGLHDELMRGGGQPRDAARLLCHYLRSLSDHVLQERKAAAEHAIRVMGITFTVYSQQGGSIDRAWPFDIVPRIIAKSEWDRIEEGLKQRVQALNLFIDDIYHDQRIVKDKIFPVEILAGSKNFRPQCVGVRPPLGVWAHVCGSDLVRDRDGTMYVLEDNLRVPSGVSYMLENRQVMKRVFPELFRAASILPVDAYPSQLFACLASLSPRRAFSRSRGVRHRFDARRAGPAVRMAARHGRARQCAGRRRGRRQGGVCLCAADDPLLSRSGPLHSQCRNLFV